MAETNRMVTVLEIDARPAQQGAATYERAMQKLEQAAEKAAEQEARVQRARAAGIPVINQVGAATGKAAAQWDRLRASTDPVFAAQQKIQTAIARSTEAVRRGNATYEEAVNVIDAVRRKHEQLANANDNLRSEVVQSDRAFDRFRNSIGATDERLGRLQGGMSRASTQFGSLRMAAAGALGGIGVYEVVSGFIKMSDEATKLEGRLKLVTTSSTELASVQARLFQVSQETRSTFGSNVELYARASQATAALGVSQDDLIKLTTVLNQGFSISGATAQEASNAIIQLSQGLSAGALRGEEFNSVNEGGARITRALADSLGVTVGQLRELAGEGKLTTEVVVKGLLSQAGRIGDEFAKVPRTVGDAMTQVGNSMLRAVDSMNDAGNATAGLVTQIDRFRATIDSPAFTGTATAVFSSIANDLRTLNELFANLQAVQEWGAAIQTAAGEGRAAISEAAASLYTTWKTSTDQSMALIAPWVEAWTGGILQVMNANEAAAANAGLSWSGFVDASIDEIATLIAATKALGGIGSEAGITGTFQAEFAAAREMLDSYRKSATATGEVVLDTIVVPSNSAAIAARDLANATADARSNTEAMAPAAAASAAAITTGITAPSKAAEKALRDAETAKRALFSEADAAIKQFFPVQAAEAEATRLQALIDDTGNGLSDLQRRALGLQLDQNFIDAMKPAEGLRDDVRGIGDEMRRTGGFVEEVGDIFADVFSSATRDGESFFQSVIQGFAAAEGQIDNSSDLLERISE